MLYVEYCTGVKINPDPKPEQGRMPVSNLSANYLPLFSFISLQRYSTGLIGFGQSCPDATIAIKRSDGSLGTTHEFQEVR
jgi:hypothetical protein